MRGVSDKPSRNDPCWCGSGEKYKRCHLAKDGASERPDPRALVTPSRPVHARRERREGALLLSQREQDGMRAAGKFNAQLMDELRRFAQPGVTLLEVDAFIDTYTRDHGHIPACLGYKGYPRSFCSSVNEVVCHGIPDDYVLREGDIVNYDITSIVGGWHGDQSETFLIGQVSDEARRLTQCAFDCLWRGIAAIKPNGRVRDIGRAIVDHAHAQGFSVVRDFQGHGIGRKFHQDPGIPHYPEHHYGEFVIKPGMCFTIEPMINAGKPGTVIDSRDGWTARTVDGRLSAQFEHTILMTEEGPEVLTLTPQGPRAGHRF